MKGWYQVLPDGDVTSPAGFSAAGLHCGIKKTSRFDLGVIYSEIPAVAAAVYTRNKVQAAPLKITRESLDKEGRLQAVVVNSGNANACTGKQGETDAREMRAQTARILNVEEHHVAVASTGVIGELMPMTRILAGIARFPEQLGPDRGPDFRQAILTTDLTEKHIAATTEVNGKRVTIGGTAKGSGMIHPDMATMLAFLTTDAVIAREELARLLAEVTETTFNMITVDGDTSTNDMTIAMANGKAGNESLHPEHPDWEAFRAAFHFVAEHLAKEIARDGEGATKLIEVNVHGAVSDASARQIAKTVLGSSLVKTAVFGADANWGRIIAAAGRAGEPLDPDTVDIRIGDIFVLERSRPVPFDEERATEYLKKTDTVRIDLFLHLGEGSATGWGCDLTYEYVRINAAYRT